MQRANPPQFRPTLTLWTADVAALPAVRPLQGYPTSQWDPTSPMRRLPEDFAIQECLELDVQDDNAVIDFVRNWGTFAPASPRSIGAGLPTSGLEGWPAFNRVDLESHDPDWGTSPNIGVSAQRLYLIALRACAEHYLATVSGEPMEAAWRRHGFRSWHPTYGLAYFMEFMNGALAAFPPFLLLDDPPDWLNTDGRVDPTTYEIAMLQLATAVSQGRVLRTCANVRCGRSFTRQRGRAKYPGNEHQRGVKYCSAGCAKAQSERERRARRRQASETKGS